MHRSTRLGLVTALAFFAAPLAAQSNQPIPLGPVGGSAISIAVDPQDPNTILAVKYRVGLFRSTDGGQSFAPYGTGISNGIEDMTLDPRDDQTLFALDGDQIFRSTDFGASWSVLGLTASSSLKDLAIPTSGTTVLALDAFNVYRSSDDGATWSVTASTVPFAGTVFDSIEFAPSDPSIAYFSTNNGVRRSGNGGQTFTQPGAFSQWIQHLTVSPTDPNTVLAGGITDVWRSTDGAASFTALGGSLPARANAEFFRWEPGSSRLWYGDLNGVWWTTDLGNTWVDANAGFPAVFPIPADLAFDGTGKIYLGTESNFLSGFVGGGVHRRASATAPWEHIAYNEVTVDAVAIASPGGTRLIATGSGPYAGAPGQPVAATAWSLTTTTVAVDPSNSDRWLTGGVGAFSDNAQIIALTGGGTELAVAYEQFGAGVTQDIDFSPHDPTRAVAGIFPGGFGNAAIIASSNGGASWTAAAGTAGWATRSVAFSPHAPGVVLQLSDNNQWAVSFNNGQSWGPLRPPWPATGAAVLIEFDPFTQGILYRGDEGSGLWRSDNGGDTWTALGVSLHGDSDIALHPEFPGLLWVSDASGVVRSSGDHGNTFVDAFDVPSGANGSGLAIDTANGNLLVGTTGASTWELPAASPLVKLGDGSPGTSAFVPRHYGSGGLPQLGNAGWGLTVDQTVGGGATFLLLGASAISAPVFGGTLFVGAPLAFPAGTASGTPGTAGEGAATFPIPIPVNPALAGAPLVSQYLVVDAGAAHPSGIVLSDGLLTVLMP